MFADHAHGFDIWESVGLLCVTLKMLLPTYIQLCGTEEESTQDICIIANVCIHIGRDDIGNTHQKFPLPCNQMTLMVKQDQSMVCTLVCVLSKLVQFSSTI